MGEWNSAISEGKNMSAAESAVVNILELSEEVQYCSFIDQTRLAIVMQN